MQWLIPHLVTTQWVRLIAEAVFPAQDQVVMFGTMPAQGSHTGSHLVNRHLIMAQK